MTFDRSIGAAGGLFSAMLVVNKLDEGTTPLVLCLGAVLCSLFFGVFLAAVFGVVRGFSRELDQGVASRTVQTALAMVQMLGGLLLFLVSVWGWGVFGLGRLVGAPSLQETVLIPLLLLGASGTWLQQRSGASLVCGIGLWWLAQDCHRFVSPAGLIVATLTACMLVCWPRLQNTPW